MPAAHRDETVTDRTAAMLVCVYYRVAACDSQRVISAVREFQRTLHSGADLIDVQVLLRCDLSRQDSLATLPDARTFIASPDPAAGSDAGAESTVMETYRLRLPATASPDVDDAVRAFLAVLETASRPLASLLRGARHVELFVPCAS